MNFLIGLLLSFFLSLAFTPAVIFWAKKFGIFDRPDHARKIHQQPVPLLGGLAIFLSFFIGLGLFLTSGEVIEQALQQSQGAILPKNLWGIFIGGLIIMIWGFFDDRFRLPPRYSIIGPILAVMVVIVSGVGINFITNPFGGLLPLNQWQTELFKWQDVPYRIFWLADIFTFLWLLTMMYTTKLLDGVDGLVSGISGVAALFIFFLSLKINQPFTALMALIFLGANLGFLFFNFHPAKIFLGEGGSIWAGFMIGILAIISGGKVATTFLIMGIPFLDLLWVTLRRVLKEKRSFAQADRKHLHHRLLESGLDQRKSVLILYLITAVFGLAALFLQSFGKLLAMGVLLLTMIILAGTLVWLGKKKSYGRLED